MPARKPATAAGLPVPDPVIKPEEEAPRKKRDLNFNLRGAASAPKPNPLFVYAKALIALLVGEATAVTTWSVAIGTAHIDRTGWISLGAAVLGPMAAALGVAVTTNQGAE